MVKKERINISFDGTNLIFSYPLSSKEADRAERARGKIELGNKLPDIPYKDGNWKVSKIEDPVKQEFNFLISLLTRKGIQDENSDFRVTVDDLAKWFDEMMR